MEAPAPAPVAPVGSRREPSIDAVKAQGVLRSVTRKTKDAARLWQKRWGFYSLIREIQEEEAQKMGMSLEEYREAVRSVNCRPEPKVHPVEIQPSPEPVPHTSAGMVGRRARCSLEQFGRLVMTDRDYPLRPPLSPGQIYDPYNQTIVFLGSVDGDPISYNLPAARAEVSEAMWARPHQLEVMPLSKDNLERALLI